MELGDKMNKKPCGVGGKEGEKPCGVVEFCQCFEGFFHMNKALFSAFWGHVFQHLRDNRAGRV